MKSGTKDGCYDEVIRIERTWGCPENQNLGKGSLCLDKLRQGIDYGGGSVSKTFFAKLIMAISFISSGAAASLVFDDLLLNFISFILSVIFALCGVILMEYVIVRSVREEASK